MSKLSLEQTHLRLNAISKQNGHHRISVIVGGNLSIAELKNKLQAELWELYPQLPLITHIFDHEDFLIPNSSTVGQHFHLNSTIYFTEHQPETNQPSSQKTAQLWPTIRSVINSSLDRLDKLGDKMATDALPMIAEIGHIAFWYANEEAVCKLFKLYNKVFGQETIDQFMEITSEIQQTLLIRSFTLWLMEIQSPTQEHQEICWEILQLIEKFTYNYPFIQILKSHKLMKTIVEMSKDSFVNPEMKKLALKIIKNTNSRTMKKGLSSKTKSAYIPSIMSGSLVDGCHPDDILDLLNSHSQDDKMQAIEALSDSNSQLMAELTVGYEHYEKIVQIFTVRKLKNRRQMTLLNQVINSLNNHTNKEKAIHVMQKNILKKVHDFFLETPVELHHSAMQYIKKVIRWSVSSGMFNIEKGGELLNSPYEEFQKLMIEGLCTMSDHLNETSSIRFIPALKQQIKLCLKTKDQSICRDILRLLSNLSLDEQCKYHLINLKGIQVFIKFLQTSKAPQIWRYSAKGLLNLTISSRQNKVKVLGLIDKILELYYEGSYDNISRGYIETIIKSKNI